MIPQEKIEAVARGLREAFGVTEFEDISRIFGGHTASLVFRIIVRGSPYLLKIITRTEDPTRHYQSMRTAAEMVWRHNDLFKPDNILYDGRAWHSRPRWPRTTLENYNL